MVRQKQHAQQQDKATTKKNLETWSVIIVAMVRYPDGWGILIKDMEKLYFSIAMFHKAF